MSEAEILFEVKDGLGVITLNRPKALNALTHGMILEMEKVIPGWEKDQAVKAVVLRGSGDRAFCAGGDVTGFKSAGDDSAFPRSLLHKLPRAYDFSRRPDYQSRAAYFPAIGKPIIAMLNGATAGLGLVHALYADMRFAADDAVLTTAFARLGLASEYGMAWALRNAVGHANALDLLLSARKVRGEEALRLGLVNRIHPREELAEATYAYARELAESCSPLSLRMIKRQLWELPFQTLHEALMADSADMMQTNLSEDFEEGKLAFKEKRKPRFKGR